MLPMKYNFVCWQGKTFEELWWFYSGPNKDPMNFTGYTARMQVREISGDEDVILELTTENGGIEIDPAHAQVTLYASDETTAELAPGKYKYDLELESASGRVYGPLYGSFRVKPEVTKPSE